MGQAQKLKFMRKHARKSLAPVIEAETNAARIFIKSKPWWMPHFVWAFLLNKFAEARRQAGAEDYDQIGNTQGSPNQKD